MTIGDNPDISFVYGNMLRVNKKKLWADVLIVPDAKKLEVVTPDQFAAVLDLGRKAIQGVQQQMPEVWALRLSTDADTNGRESYRVYTPKGYDNTNAKAKSDAGEDPALTEIDDIVEEFHPYWEVAQGADFTPKVMGVGGKVDGGAWLLLRNTPERD